MYDKVLEQALSATIEEMDIDKGEYVFSVEVVDYNATASHEVLEPILISLPRFDTEPEAHYAITITK